MWGGGIGWRLGLRCREWFGVVGGEGLGGVRDVRCLSASWIAILVAEYHSC